MADSKSLPVEESLEKPFPHPVQEIGDQRDFPVNVREQPQERAIEENTQFEDPPMYSKLIQLMIKVIQTVGNLSLANIFAILFAAAIGIYKILSEWEIPEENIRERDEMKKTEDDIKKNLKEIEHDKCYLEKKIRKAHETDYSRISFNENKELEMKFITTKYLVATCGFEMTYLQGLVGRLESGAKSTVSWITFQLVSGLSVVCGMLYYHWAYAKETDETGTTVKSITVGSLLVLGMAIFCARKARVLFNNKELVLECKQVKNELERTKLDYIKIKQAVEIALPEQKKLLHVMDHEASLYRSLQRLKCKDE